MRSVPSHLRRLAALAGPMIAAQLGAMLLTVVDVVMLGRVSVAALDAASLGRVWVLGTIVFAMGLLFGIDPVASHAHGAGDEERLGASLGHGLGLAAIVTGPVALAWLVTEPVLLAAGQSRELAGLAEPYVFWQLPGLPFFLGFVVLKQYLQARGIVYPPMWVTFAGNVVNVFANWVLIFGHLGVPAMGVSGAGLATSITHVVLFVGLLGWMGSRGRPRVAWRLVVRHALESRGLGELTGYGWPVAVQLGLEMWTFQIATLMAGGLGHVPLAAHTVAMTLASITFMVPLGISLAAVVRVGNLVGAGEGADARRAAWVAFGLGGGVMTLSALVFWLGRFQLPLLFTSDRVVVAAAAGILPIAAAFQVFDGIQVVGSGILRGMGQTRPAAAFNLLGFYGLALPAAWWLAFVRGLGVEGLWWGLCLGLATVALLFLWWVRAYGPSGADAGMA